jgi:2-amino-4-hydroxy-6-hydroxymethyldihydropteridine diphosphokinase
MSGVEIAAFVLPPWAKVSEKRRAHIGRVTALLEEWGAAMRIGAEEARAWRDAGLLHDALRDASAEELRALADLPGLPAEMLHGPAAAARLETDGERRADLLAAVRWHTVGHAGWGRVGRALYMADFLEPGRKFSRADRAYLAAHVPHDFDGTFRQVVRARIEWAVREGNAIYPQTIALWDEVR